MSRIIRVDDVIVDQFPVWELDGFTKKGGMVEADFDVTIYKDGVIYAGHAFTIAEISGGEYRFQFTPDASGFWLAEVSIEYNGEVWYGNYDVVDIYLSDLWAVARRALGLSKENMMIDNTVYNQYNQQTNCRVRIFRDRYDLEAATEGGISPPDPEPLATYEMDTTWVGVNEASVVRMKRL